MSVITEKAKEILKKANKDFTDLCALAAEDKPLDKEANQLYQTTAELNVLTSQFVDVDEPKEYEGNIKVNNEQAMVSIQGIEIRGFIEFEILHEGKWIKGYRDSSQYGQVFRAQEEVLILSDSVKGRVSVPLKMYKSK